MNIYKLKYSDKESAISDLIAKGILKEVTFNGETSFGYGEGVEAVVYVGQIVDKPAVMEGMTVKTPATFIEGYHVDVMASGEYNFTNSINVKNPVHQFA